MTVSIDDVATTLLRPTPPNGSLEANAWAMWIDDAERQIEARLGPLDELDPATLAYVVREAVALKVKRPDPVLKVDVTVDDASTSKTYEKSSGHVAILEEWWAMLTPADDGYRGAFTINPFGNRRRKVC